MTTRTVRKIVKIDEELCNGCGLCVPGCVEGALQIVDGKARLVSETYCDGLGACLGECPEGAITIEEREAKEFDEEATRRHTEQVKQESEPLPCGCPGTTVQQFDREEETAVAHQGAPILRSTLAQWPVQLTLVPSLAPFLRGADILLTADCVPFAYADFHQGLLKNHTLLVACPKLDDSETHLRKLTEILRESQPKSLTVVHMEVPCCFGLVQMAKQAIALGGQDTPLKEVTVSVRGEVLP